jgi:HK97 family phage portal protein
MGYFDFLKKGNKPIFNNSKIDILQSQVVQLQRLLNVNASTVTQYPNYTKVDNSTRYCTTDDIYSIVNLIASTAAMIPFYAYQKDKDGNLVDIDEEHSLSKLVSSPLYGMTRYQSYFAMVATSLIQGEVILWKEVPELGPNKNKLNKLHFLEPENVNIKVSTSYPFNILAYQYVVNGEIIMDNIPVNEIVHHKTFNPKIGIYGTELRGLSPLKVLAKRLTRVDTNLDTSTAQLQNGGVPGIVYEKGQGQDELVDILGNRKKKFYEYLSNKNNKGAPYFAAGELGYIELGLKLADMEVSALATIDFKKLCNVYKISDRLFNNDATGSEVSDKGARVGLYTNAVMPELTVIKDIFNTYVVTFFTDKKYCVEFDISEISELQQDYAKLVEWLDKAWWLTPNQKLRIMKFEKSTDPMFDKYFLPTNLITLEDMEDVKDLTQTGDYNVE